MMGAMRLVSVQRGYDPRQFVLVAFGGAGPLHANALAQALNIPTVLIPPSPGIASALGMLMTDIQHAFVATRRQVLSSLQPQALEVLFREFETEGETMLAREGIAPQQHHLLRSIDLRYQGQSHELSVSVPAGPLTPQHLHDLQEQFHAAHVRAYGYDAREDAVELVNIRLTAVGSSPKPRFPTLSEGSAEVTHAVKAQRPVWFSETAGFTDCPVVDRSRLLWGNVIPGPAVVEELDATALIHPGYQATVDQHGNLVLRRSV
jgi:N-methylhydantoinase A